MAKNGRKGMAVINIVADIGLNRHAKGTGTQKATGIIQIEDTDGMKVAGMKVTKRNMADTKVANIVISS